MTQEQMIKNMVQAAGEGGKVTMAAMERAYKCVFENIEEACRNGETVSVRGFGTFSLKETKARQGRNPQTGDTIEIPAGKKISFKNSASLKERL